MLLQFFSFISNNYGYKFKKYSTLYFIAIFEIKFELLILFPDTGAYFTYGDWQGNCDNEESSCFFTQTYDLIIFLEELKKSKNKLSGNFFLNLKNKSKKDIMLIS